MNRRNIWIHISIAVVIIGVAALAGQISRWKSATRTTISEKTSKITPKPVVVQRSATEREAEVLVKFKPNVSLADIRKIAAKNNEIGRAHV